jgi:hypothetical protein
MHFPVGISNFKELIQGGYQFIDKTLFIKEIIEDSAKVIVITRPRRFGKTMNMSMLQQFLQYEKENVFSGLAIKDNEEFCQKHQNKYPVIFVSFKGIKHTNFLDAYAAIRELLSKLYEEHAYLLDGNALSESEKAKFERIRNKTTEDSAEISYAMANLTLYTKKKYNQLPILLIDEYDTPIHSAYAEGYYKEMIGFMRIVLGEALKDNNELGKAVITGITRVAKESLFSGVNNLEVYSLLRKHYGQYFGFTEEEVKSILPGDGSIPIEPICEWYNGYQIGEYRVYNPWSIINCFKNDGILSPYWVNTSDNALVYRMVENAKPSVKIRFEELIQGKTQRQELSDNLTFGYLENDENAIWTLLVHTGYLNVVSSELDDNGQLFAIIAIPNKEVMSIYVQMVKKWFMLSNQASNYYNELLATLEQGDVNEFKEHVAEYIRESGSYFDFSKNTPERVFHVFMLGLLVGLRSKYEISSNKEAGNGRYDIIFIPKYPQQRGIILEFKTIDKVDLLLSKAKEALEQIKDKEYFQIFRQHNIESVLAIGLAFCGKQVEVAHENLNVANYLRKHD